MEPHPETLTGRAITLPLTGIDVPSAIDALTAADLGGKMTHDMATHYAAIIRAAGRGERLPDTVAPLVAAAAVLLCGGGR